MLMYPRPIFQATVRWCSRLSRELNMLKVSGSIPGQTLFLAFFQSIPCIVDSLYLSCYSRNPSKFGRFDQELCPNPFIPTFISVRGGLAELVPVQS